MQDDFGLSEEEHWILEIESHQRFSSTMSYFQDVLRGLDVHVCLIRAITSIPFEEYECKEGDTKAARGTYSTLREVVISAYATVALFAVYNEANQNMIFQMGVVETLIAKLHSHYSLGIIHLLNAIYVGNSHIVNKTPDEVFWHIAKVLHVGSDHTSLAQDRLPVLQFFNLCVGPGVSIAKKRVVFRALISIKAHEAVVDASGDDEYVANYFTRLILIYASCCKTTRGAESTRVVSVITKLSSLFPLHKLLGYLQRIRKGCNEKLDCHIAGRVDACRKLLTAVHFDIDIPARAIFKNQNVWDEVQRCMITAVNGAGSDNLSEGALCAVACFLEQLAKLPRVDPNWILSDDQKTKLNDMLEQLDDKGRPRLRHWAKMAAASARFTKLPGKGKTEDDTHGPRMTDADGRPMSQNQSMLNRNAKHAELLGKMTDALKQLDNDR
jgi:hypothetical protein